MTEEVQRHTVHTLIFRSLKRTHDMFRSDHFALPPVDPEAERIRRKCKESDMFAGMDEAQTKLHPHLPIPKRTLAIEAPRIKSENNAELPNSSVVPVSPSIKSEQSEQVPSMSALAGLSGRADIGVMGFAKPKWHAPWKLMRVISGHQGWVRCIAVDTTNQWFVTGANDRVIKIWDLASGNLKLSLTGHVSTVRGVEVSARMPYLFSCGEDRQVKCWDLEQNKVVRHYHGHLSAVHALSLHPTIDVLVTCGRDSTARVWDIRTKTNVFTLTGHTNTVTSVLCQKFEPQIVTGSQDSTVRLWDLRKGVTKATLTHHKKSVRALAAHPSVRMFASASPDSIKEWKGSNAVYVQTLTGHNTIINALAVNDDGVLVSGGNNGTMHLWDWMTGYNFQRLQAPVQPGSMENEAGINALCFDRSGSRLISAESDKTIKIFKEDDEAMIAFNLLCKCRGTRFSSAVRTYIRKSEAAKIHKRLVSPDVITHETDAKWLAISKNFKTAETLERFPVEKLYSIEDLFNAKFHLGHKEGSLDPRMRPFLYGSRLGHLIFDLDQASALLGDALNFVAHVAARDGIILFVTRHPATIYLVEKAAKEVHEFSHCRPWQPGLFTDANNHYGAVTRLPDLVVVTHTRDGAIGPHPVIRDAAKMLIPTVAIVDSDCDPNLITYPVPGNDDSSSSVQLFLNLISKAISMGKTQKESSLVSSEKLHLQAGAD
ncbi:unnamed protein product [Notodromas monacha]|uniref:Pleiotropic regulator 1 n=1 Tax=Notodromas monacha TaxID=399045 RepID=A0A7R9BXG0_9CRUS|nr:unnamed protein product [Notodromas monacha]CAG0921907.1 unnamed protein product [Notodromas monacha]